MAEAVWLQDGASIGADTTGDGGEGGACVQAPACDVGRGLVFSGVAEIRRGDELRRAVGLQSGGGDVRGAEDADVRDIPYGCCVADGEPGGAA